MEIQADLPPSVYRLLQNCPDSGSGERLVHRWIMETGNQLRHYMLIDSAGELIRGYISRQPKPREIEETLEKAYGESAHDIAGLRATWPRPIAQLIDDTVSENDVGTPGLELLRKRSAPIPAKAADIFKIMFPGDPFICVGLDQMNPVVAKLSRLSNLERFQFVVPNPMGQKFVTDPGTGRRMERCLANVPERHYIVLDFDLKGVWIQAVLNRWERVKYTPQDGMATLISFMERSPGPAPLVLVVFSGNVSLQAWFCCLGLDEEQRLAAWFNDACLLGADPAGWIRCQYFRMPGARRKNPPNLQETIFFNPDAI